VSDNAYAISGAPPNAAPAARVEDRRIPSINPLEFAMLRWALIFAVIAVVAGLFGFTGIEAGAAEIAKALFYIFVGLVVVFLVLGVTIFKKM
jgi:uncharacterized membrane protein YtjA (UPF0391 family)